MENEQCRVGEWMTKQEVREQNHGRCENIQILIVDDSNFSRSLIVKELNEMGIENHQIQQSCNGADALSKIKSKQFDLFILDIIMEGIDGISVLREVKKFQPHGKVIMCSGSNSDEMVKELIDLGIDAFIVKPFSSEFFQKAVCRTLSRQLECCNNRNSYWAAKCHVCDRKMIEVNWMNTVGFFCPSHCMKIGPLATILVTQTELDEDYEKAIQKRKEK